MTEAELVALIEGIAPVVRDYVKAATQRHELELGTLRDAVLPRLHAAETGTQELETRIKELRLELDASAATVRA
jgi:hypothetical protein